MPNKNKKTKPKVAILSLTSCEGCQFAFLDRHADFLDLTSKIDLVEMRLVKEKDEELGLNSVNLSNINAVKRFDIAFVEGSPISRENYETLKTIRKKTDVLVAMGACAAIGGIYHLKNYYDKNKLIKYIYSHIKHIHNEYIPPIDELIKVDYYLPGCPITGKEFYGFMYSFLFGKKPFIFQSPVCQECQNNKYECVLQKGEPCLGPITLGGCNAVCLKSKMPCYGCRGLRENPEIDQLLDKIKENTKDKRISQILEMFGVKDKAEIHKKNKK